MGYSAILFYGYVGVIGFLLYAVLHWGFKGQTSLVQTWCAYGISPLYESQSPYFFQQKVDLMFLDC